MKTKQPERTDIQDLGPLLNDLSVNDLFFVVDRQAFAATGVEQILKPLFDRRRVFEFSNFEENPKLEDICRGVDAIRNQQIDVMVAMGGGTAIDVAKLIRFFGAQNSTPQAIMEDPSKCIMGSFFPLIAIPTTSGTGSEATHFAVVYADGAKHSIAHDSILPEFSIVDPQLTWSQPPRLTAVSGLDALCQAMESMWSVHATPQSTFYASQSLELAFANLHSAVHSPTPAVRDAMSRAAHLSGRAINISKTTAPHACSYAITMNHGVPHGHAVAFTLAPFLEFNRQVTQRNVADPRGVPHVYHTLDRIIDTLGCKNASDAQSAILSLMESIGCATRLGEMGIISDSQIQRLAKGVNVERLKNNPRSVTQDDVLRILESIR